jgi:hypothetical protein
VELPAGKSSLTAPGLAGELPGAGLCDSVCLDALMRAARRAQGWGSRLRLVVPDAGARRVIRLVALDEAMPVYASVNGALAAAAREAAMAEVGGH